MATDKKEEPYVFDPDKDDPNDPKHLEFLSAPGPAVDINNDTDIPHPLDPIWTEED